MVPPVTSIDFEEVFVTYIFQYPDVPETRLTDGFLSVTSLLVPSVRPIVSEVAADVFKEIEIATLLPDLKPEELLDGYQ